MTLFVAIRNMFHNNSDTAPPHTMPAESETGLDIEALSPRQLRTVLVCDVVESVRWMEHDEDNAITRWSQFAAAVRCRIAPEHAGSVVKSTGDGLMLEFESAPQAVAAANAMQKLSAEGNAGFEPERQMHLRVGIHQAQVRRDAHDLYGHGVNLAARISTLAGPGEIIVTPEVRDHLTDSLDGDIEDMGECYLKHLSEPKRVYRVSSALSPTVQPIQRSEVQSIKLQAVVAVIPLQSSPTDATGLIAGDLIADAVIARLSRSRELKVISRLSTRQMRNRQVSVADMSRQLSAEYIVSGQCHSMSGKLVVQVEMCQTKDATVLWAHRLTVSLGELFDADSEACGQIASACHQCILRTEVGVAAVQPLYNLPSYTLFLGALNYMHRASRAEFQRAFDMLDRLIELSGRHSTPRAWLSKWYILKVAQGWSEKPEEDASIALDHCHRALDYNSKSALALSITGQVHGYLRHDLDQAEDLYQQALTIDSSESLAWLWSGMGAAFAGHALGDEALIRTRTAIELSPLDPMAYYYRALSASAAIAAGQYDLAVGLAKDAIRLNKTHTSSYRSLAIAHMFAGNEIEAKAAVNQLIALEPGLTVYRFKQRYPRKSASDSYLNKLANALAAAGLPT